MKMQIHSLPLGVAFGAVKIMVSPVTLVHKVALRSQTLLYQAFQMRWNENETNHSRLASHKGGVWKNESLSESFGSHWASKVKKKSVFDLACMSTSCWELPKPKYEPSITHNRGTLISPDQTVGLLLFVETWWGAFPAEHQKKRKSHA